MPFHSIAYIIGEYCHTSHLTHILLERTLLRRQGRITGSPAFSVYEYGGVYFFQLDSHLVHSFYVVNGHQIESETVDMVFIRPILHRVDYEVAHLLALGGSFVTAAGRIAIAAVGTVTVIVAGSSKRKVGLVVICSVVVHDVHHHADAGIVERFDHLLHFQHSCGRIGRVGRIGAFGSIVVERIIAPVILV